MSDTNARIEQSVEIARNFGRVYGLAILTAEERAALIAQRDSQD